MSDLIAQLEANNKKYWAVRNRVIETQKQLKNGSFRFKKIKTRKITNKFIQAGIIIKKSCEVCGNKKVETHHKDYNKPKEVTFLCKKHHTEWHKNNIPIY